VNATEEKTPGVDAQFAAEQSHAPHLLECEPCDCSTLLHLFEDAVMDEVKELRHNRKCCDSSLPKSAQEFRRVQRGKKYGSRPRGQR